MKYKVEIDIDTMREVKQLIYFCSRAFMPDSVWNLYREFDKIILNGCFKHSILREDFRTSPQSTTSVCPKCSPKEYARLCKTTNTQKI